jgi:dihydroflavonol-4-reductase
MRIFITGITGFLGFHVAKACAQAGHDVVALVRRPTQLSLRFPFPVELHCGELGQQDVLRMGLASVDAVIHCAADARMGAFENDAQKRTNIQGLKSLMAAARTCGVKRFIYISTANTIQPGTAERLGDETVLIDYNKHLLPYVKSKIIAESILRLAFQESRFPMIILNPTFILGPDGVEKSSGKLLLTALGRKLVFVPRGGKNVVDVRDVSTAVLQSLAHGQLGETYLLSNQNLSYNELFQCSCAFAGLKPFQCAIPNHLLWLLGALGTAYERLTGKSFAVNHKTMALATQQHFYTSAKAKRELGFEPRNVEETLEDTIKYLKNGAFFS